MEAGVTHGTPRSKSQRVGLPIYQQYQLERQDYDEKLVDNAAWLLTDHHIEVVRPSIILQDFPHQNSTVDESTMVKLQGLFLEALQSIKEDQKHGISPKGRVKRMKHSTRRVKNLI